MATTDPSKTFKPYPLSKTLTGHKRAIFAVKFSSADKTLRTYSTSTLSSDFSDESPSPLQIYDVHHQGVFDLAFSSDFRFLVSGSDNKTHTNCVFCVNFNPKSNMIVSGSFDETVRVWDFKSGKCLKVLPAHSDPVTAVDFGESGKIAYNGHGLNEFVPQRTAAYVSQTDWHVAEMTERETLEFAGRCQGVGFKYDMLLELSRREKMAGIRPDEHLDIFMKSLALGGHETSIVVGYILKAIEGVPKIRPGYNPAAWMLEVTSSAEENRLGVDFAEIYPRSYLFQHNRDLVENLSNPSSNSKELNFPTQYSQSFLDQFLACLWKQNLSYWRNPQYTAVRFFYTVIISLMLGTICWRFGSKRDLSFRVGSIYQFIGELFIQPNNEAILSARVGRNVDGIDLNLYHQSLQLLRQFQAEHMNRSRT